MRVENRIRWGILGTGRINRALINPIKSSNKSVLNAVASRSLDRAERYAQEWQIPGYYGSYEQLLDDPNIDVIYNSLPNALHAEWSLKALQHGKHVLCEKPFTTNNKELLVIMDYAHKSQLHICEAFMYRHHPQTLLVKELISQAEIGEIQFMRGTFSFTLNRPADPRLDPTLGGGSLWDVGCYPISFARFLAGEEPSEAYGQQLLGPTGIDLFFAGQLTFPGSIITQVDCSFASPYRQYFEITGETGRIKIPEPFKPGKHSSIHIENEAGSREIPVKGMDLYQGELEDMENAILNAAPNRISLEESLGNVRTIELLYASARSSMTNES